MKYTFINQAENAELTFFFREKELSQNFTQKKRRGKYFTIALNLSADQLVILDGNEIVFQSGTLIPLFTNQSFEFQEPQKIIAWQYNCEFYNGMGVDLLNSELSSSLLENRIISLDPSNSKKIGSIATMFLDEFSGTNNAERDMLEILLRQLIVIVYRLAREQHLNGQESIEERNELISRYNKMVEIHFKEHHQVLFYADKLHKSPKTLSNLFLLYNYRSPILVIHERIIKEAKKLFYYTDKSAKEIAYELGFQEQAHFSRFFKNHTDQSPTHYKKSFLYFENGKN
ncbi:helix-turn-helix domain-containing protein [Pedobacter jamesrossensis]